jgi:hypothetical protein
MLSRGVTSLTKPWRRCALPPIPPDRSPAAINRPHYSRGLTRGLPNPTATCVGRSGRARSRVGYTVILPHGIPSHDTFGRVFARLDPAEFEACFLCWIRALDELLPAEVVAVDGKELRRSVDGQLASRPSAWSVSGPATSNWFWARSRSTRNPTRALPSQNH